MQKIFLEGEARSRLLGGAEILRNAVAATLSPLGRNVIIKKEYGTQITHDGVTVAEAIVVSDKELAAGADIIKEAAGKVNNEVGDGTTSVTVLTFALMQFLDQIISEDLNAMLVRRDLIKVQTFLQKELKELTKDLTDEKLLDVAAISVGDKELGAIIGQLAIEVGAEGNIIVELGGGYETEPQVKDGFVFERSYLSPYFITDKKRQAAVLDQPAIIITSEKLRTYEQVSGLIAGLGDGVKSALIICEELAGDALATVVQSHTRGLFPMAAVQAPAFGDARRELLEDIAVLTGGAVHNENQSGLNGKAAQVVITKDSTTIVGGKGNVTERVAEIKARIEEAQSDYDKEQLEARIANLIGKVGVIKVGGSSESEVGEKKDRVDDAVAAVKAAQLGGIVAGGGVTYYNLATALEQSNIDIHPSVKNAVAAALKEPLATICKNGNLPYSTISEHVMNHVGRGVNVLAPNGYVNMIDEGIVDPSRLVEKVIEYAFSIAMTAITTDVLVVDIPDEV